MISPYSGWQLILGPTVWGIWFSAVYGGLSVGCVIAPPDPEKGPWTWINISLWLFTVLVVLLLLRWAWRCWREIRRESPQQPGRRRFIAVMGAGLHLMSALGTLFIGVPILILAPCI